jgi:hypothetical protein
MAGRIHLQHQPMVNNLHNVALLVGAQRPAWRDRVPLFEAAATAGGGGVLGDKYRMTAHRRLLAVIRDIRRCQSAGNKIRRVLVNDLRPFIDTVLPLFATKMEAGTKGRPLETGK